MIPYNKVYDTIARLRVESDNGCQYAQYLMANILAALECEFRAYNQIEYFSTGVRDSLHNVRETMESEFKIKTAILSEEDLARALEDRIRAKKSTEFAVRSACNFLDK